jgi:uncharacterized protein with PIN domain
MKSFVVDAMLGKLALWLRLTGHDTVYLPDIHDDKLLEISEKEGRVLLTSDEQLDQRATAAGLESMLLRGDVDERIALAFHKFNISTEIDPSRSRCSKCNGELTELNGNEKISIKGLVPQQTYNHYDSFWLCESCRSVFFQGGQWSNMIDYMQRIANLVNEMNE